MYHHISSDSTKWNSATISPNKFKEEMLYLKVLGFNPIHFTDYIDYVDGKKELPENPIFITFDDGYYSNYEYAYPLLKDLDMKATISVIGWSVGREFHKDGQTRIIKHFTWEQAKEMYESGVIDIQHHTFDLHNEGDGVNNGKGVCQLTNEDIEEYKKRITDDTLKLKNMIEKNVGNKVILYVYPYGIHNNIVEKIIQDLGFRVSITTKEGIKDISKGTYTLDRINMPQSISSIELIKKILNLQNKTAKIPFEDITDQGLRIEKLEQLIKK